MALKPTNQTGRYNQARVAKPHPLEAAIDLLRLPLIRQRKVLGILNAIEM